MPFGSPILFHCHGCTSFLLISICLTYISPKLYFQLSWVLYFMCLSLMAFKKKRKKLHCVTFSYIILVTQIELCDIFIHYTFWHRFYLYPLFEFYLFKYFFWFCFFSDWSSFWNFILSSTFEIMDFISILLVAVLNILNVFLKSKANHEFCPPLE